MSKILAGIFVAMAVVLFFTPIVRAGRYLLEAEIKVQKTPARLLEVWIPLPREDEVQRIESLSIQAPVPYLISREKEYGNLFLYLRLPPTGGVISYRALIVREEFSPRTSPSPAPLRYLLPARLVPLEAFQDLSQQLTQGLTSAAHKLEAIYNFVVQNMRYDKSGKGWGRGDAVFACQAKRGNCTDFHSLLMALARAAGLPTVFEIGLPVPSQGGLVRGYHCWLKVYVGREIWGVDASRAAQDPQKKNYFLGHLCDRRILLTRGRDLLLAPAQHGPRLNFMYQAYAEKDLSPAPELISTVYRVRVLSEEYASR